MTYVLRCDLVVSSMDALKAAVAGGDLILDGSFRLVIAGPIIVGGFVDPEEVQRIRRALEVCGTS